MVAPGEAGGGGGAAAAAARGARSGALGRAPLGGAATAFARVEQNAGYFLSADELLSADSSSGKLADVHVPRGNPSSREAVRADG